MMISVIIPCRDEKQAIDGLLEDIAGQQTEHGVEVIPVRNISPPGKARNTGARRAKGDVLVFIDCDIRLGARDFLSNLTAPLRQKSDIGAACAAIRVPAGAAKFALRYAREVPHSESPAVETITGVSVASSACCAIPRELFFAQGGFNEQIIRGEDSELSRRLITSGRRVVLVPRTWCYHPLPDNLKQLIAVNFRNGKGVCFVDVFYPQLNIDVSPRGIIFPAERKNKYQRILRFIGGGFTALRQGKIILLSAKLSYLIGYFYGICKYAGLGHGQKQGFQR